jgi:hypothetical protein
VVFGLQAESSDGTIRYFEKPLFLTFLMFLAMTLAFPVYWCRHWFGLKDNPADAQQYKPLVWRTMILMLVPTIFDSASTALATAGLVFTTVSVYQVCCRQ